MTDTAPSLISLLKHNAPAELQALKSEFPDAGSLFSTEQLLGDDDTASKMPNRKAVVALIRKSLGTMSAEMDAMAQSIRSTMMRVARIRFTGSLIATIAGGLTGILALAFSNEVVQAITAFAAMLGGVAAVTADQFERAPSGVRIASADEYAKLVGTRSDLELVRLKVERDAVVPVDDEALTAMLAQMDKYAMSLQYLKMA